MMSEKMIVSTHKTWTDYHTEIFTELFKKDEKTIKNLLDELNDTAPHFHITKIAKILESNKSFVFMSISALSTAAHFYLSHNSVFEEEMKNIEFDQIKEKMESFVKSLNDKGIRGLNINYLGELQHQKDDNKISTSQDELILKIIYDDKNNNVGELPIVKFNIGKMNHKGDVSIESFHIPIHTLKSLGDVFIHAYEENMGHVKKYSNKLGDRVIIYDEE